MEREKAQAMTRTIAIVLASICAGALAGPASAQSAAARNSPSQSTATANGAGNGANSAPEAMASAPRDANGKPIAGKGSHKVKVYRHNTMPSFGATQEPNGSNTARDEFGRGGVK